MADLPRIVVRDLVLHYGKVAAVKGISFEVGRGEHFTLLGPSGCGKTSTLRAIAGLEKPTSGEIVIGGRTVYSSAQGIDVPAEQRGIGMVFQSYAIWPHMSVVKNVLYGLDVRRVPKAEAQERAMNALRQVRMEQYAQRNASELSGGQQQRVSIARSLAYGPEVVLFDEPLSNLDAKLRRSMRLEIRKLQESTGMTSLYVTHDQEEALAISDRIAVMSEGRVEQLAGPRQVYAEPATAFVASFVGNANRWSATAVGAAAAGGPVEVTLPDGRRVVGVTRGACRAGQSVELFIQAAFLRLSADPPAASANTWPVRVRLAVFTGDTIQYLVDLGDEEISVIMSPTDEFEVGQEVTLSVEPRHCVVIPTADSSSSSASAASSAVA